MEEDEAIGFILFLFKLRGFIHPITSANWFKSAYRCRHGIDAEYFCRFARTTN